MPGAQERVLRRRISSVQNTKKITRAMELIAATRVVKAQIAANEARPYAEQITSVIEDLAAGGTTVTHPLLRRGRRRFARSASWCSTSDRGLAGAYNSSVIRPPSARSWRPRPRARTTRSSPSARRPRATSASATTRSTPHSRGITDRADLRERPRGGRDGHRAVRRRRRRRSSWSYTQFVSMGTQKVGRPPVPAPRDGH